MTINLPNLLSTYSRRKNDFLVGLQKMLKYASVALGSLQFEDSLPHQQPTYFFPWLYFSTRLALTLKDPWTPSLESPYKVSCIWAVELVGEGNMFLSCYCKGSCVNPFLGSGRTTSCFAKTFENTPVQPFLFLNQIVRFVPHNRSKLRAFFDI